jgi:hypothetical protein
LRLELPYIEEVSQWPRIGLKPHRERRETGKFLIELTGIVGFATTSPFLIAITTYIIEEGYQCEVIGGEKLIRTENHRQNAANQA